MSNIKSKLSEYKKDIRNPNKTIPIIENFLNELDKNAEKFISNIALKKLFEEAKLSLEEIKELNKLRTADRTYKTWKLSENAKFLRQLLQETPDNNYTKVMLTNFLLELKTAPEDLKNSPVPNLLSAIIAMGFALFPVWSYISIIIGGYHLLYRDYRNRIMGIAIFIMVIVGFFLNFVYVRQ